MLCKLLLIGTYKEGEYNAWSNLGMCHSLVAPTVMAANGLVLGTLAGTGWLNVYYRLMGAKIGKNVQIYGSIGVADLVEIGDDVIIESGAAIVPTTLSDDGLVVMFRKTVVGSGCVIGTEGGVLAGAVLGADVNVAPRSSAKGRVPRGSLVFGSKVIPRDSPKWRPTVRTGMQMPTSDGLALAQILMTFGLALQLSATLLAAIVATHEFNERVAKLNGWKGMLLMPLGWYVFGTGNCLQALVFKWGILGKVEPGQYRLTTSLFLKHWCVWVCSVVCGSRTSHPPPPASHPPPHPASHPNPPTSHTHPPSPTEGTSPTSACTPRTRSSTSFTARRSCKTCGSCRLAPTSQFVPTCRTCANSAAPKRTS